MDQNPNNSKPLGQASGLNQPKPLSNLDAFRDMPAAADDQYLFFNVMPKGAARQDDLVKPTIKVIEPEDKPVPKQSKIPELMKKYKLYVFLVIGVAVLGVAGYILINKLSEVKQENLLNTKTPANPQVQAPAAGNTAETWPAWQKRYFNTENCDPALCGEAADADHDGLSNKDEFQLKTDPNNADSDQDGLADGDEVHVFGSNPLDIHSGTDKNYSDSDYIKGGYDFNNAQKLAPDKLSQLTQKMKQFGVHPPTTKTVGGVFVSLYNFTDWVVSVSTSTASSTLPAIASSTPASGTAATSTALAGLDTSLSAQQDRDAQRSSDIQNIGVALVKYYGDSKAYPQTTDFAKMFTAVRPYLKVAPHSQDPINKQPYVYTYEPSSDGKDYTLSFYSEVAGQVIKKHAADAQKSITNEQASMYDDQRKTDLEMIKTALLLYSNKNVAGNQDYVFPSLKKYRIDLVPNYIQEMPKDPKTGADYEYAVSDTFDTFTVKAVLDAPPTGTTGYLCNQEECRNY